LLDRLTIPPRLVVRALDDLHTLAEGVRRLTEREGDLTDLLGAVRVLPEVEDQLSVRIDSLETQVGKLNQWLEPLHKELTDLDDTAEALQKALAGVQETIRAFHEELRDLRDRIPGI
jgi:predicted  nucleic acid-binding Zn-ribbon protein